MNGREKERKEVEKRRRRKGMERVWAEGKRKGRIRCGRKDEEEGEGEEKEEEKGKQKMEKAMHERHRPLQKYFLARN